MTQTKPCQCGKKMILIPTGIVLTAYPPQYPHIWWCKCGNEEFYGNISGATQGDVTEQMWELAQDPDLGPEDAA